VSAERIPTVTVRRRRILLVVLAVWASLVTMRAVFSRIDYNRVLHGTKPIFALKWIYIQDGGTVEYQGLGYELTAVHGLHYVNSRLAGYYRGPKLVYELNWLLLPWPDRSEIKFEPD
jgi:hypothetical protein